MFSSFPAVSDSRARAARASSPRQARSPGAIALRATMSSLTAALLCATSVALAAGYTETDLVANKSSLTDANGMVHTPKFTDANLVNPWGVGESGSTPFWVSDNGAGLSTLYVSDGTPQALKVTIPGPPPADPLGTDGAPTGLVFNIANGVGAFQITGCNAGGSVTSAPALFLFATEDGTILGWNPGLVPAPPNGGACTPFTGTSTHAIIVPAADKSASGAVYKGLAIAMPMLGSPPAPTPLLYATDFHNGHVDVYDASFGTPDVLAAGAFTDPKLPRGYAPFNIVPIGGDRIFVTYAVQDSDAHDDVAGMSHGIVDTYAPDGKMLARFAQHGQLNSPWGVALAPASFGEAGGKLLIGNFGNGHINIFDPLTGQFINKLRNPHGQAVVIDGLWTVMFGNGGRGGDANTLYFGAGPNDESDGLFGSLAPSQ